MSEEMQAQSACVLWIDHANQIISFTEIEGFEKKVFSSWDAKVTYAYEKGSSGYRIQ